MSGFGGEELPESTPQAGAQETTVKSDTGLMETWERANRALMDAREALARKTNEINNKKEEAVRRLGVLIPADNKGNRSGVLVGEDGRELRVGMDRGNDMFFDDPADSVRREVGIISSEVRIQLTSKVKGVYLDDITTRYQTRLRTDDGDMWRQKIASDDNYTDLRGDLGRDVLDAATDGLAFILDPGTTLKPAETPTPPFGL